MHQHREAVKAHAAKNYERGGWDYIVECYEDDRLDALLTRLDPSSEEDAIARVGRIVGAKDDRRRDIQAEAF